MGMDLLVGVGFGVLRYGALICCVLVFGWRVCFLGLGGVCCCVVFGVW